MNKIFKMRLEVTKAHVDMILGAASILFSLYMLIFGIKKYAKISFGSVGIVTDRLFPYIIMWAALFLSIGIFAMGFLDNQNDKKKIAAGKSVAKTEISIFALLMIILLVFVRVSFKKLGYPLTISVSLLAVYYMLGGRKLWQGLVVSIGFAVLSYLFFAVYLGVNLKLGFGLN